MKNDTTPANARARTPPELFGQLPITALDAHLRAVTHRAFVGELRALGLDTHLELAARLFWVTGAPSEDDLGLPEEPGGTRLDLAGPVRSALVEEWTAHAFHRKRWMRLAKQGFELDLTDDERAVVLQLAARRAVARILKRRSVKPLANAITEEATALVCERAGRDLSEILATPAQREKRPGSVSLDALVDGEERAAAAMLRRLADPTTNPEEALLERAERAEQEALARLILEEVGPSVLTGRELRDFRLQYGPEELTVEAIAERTGCALGTTKPRLRKARLKVTGEVQRRDISA